MCSQVPKRVDAELTLPGFKSRWPRAAKAPDNVENIMGFAGNPSAPRVVPLPHTGSALSVRAVTQRTTPSAFDAAIEHFAHGQWSKAFEDLVPLADSGYRDAARIVTMMAAHGPRLFGGTFAASSSQRKRWHEIASRAYPAE
jgi:hypothetical protein